MRKSLFDPSIELAEFISKQLIKWVELIASKEGRPTNALMPKLPVLGRRCFCPSDLANAQSNVGFF